MKKLIVFDLDGTLAKSKSALDAEMSTLLHDLLEVAKVAVISGGDWPQFEKQLLSHLPRDQSLTNLSVLPTCGTKFFRYSGNWTKIYSEDFTADEKKKIIDSLNKAPLAEKEKWDPDFAKRKKVKAILDPLIPGFSVRLGGATSIAHLSGGAWHWWRCRRKRTSPA